MLTFNVIIYSILACVFFFSYDCKFLHSHHHYCSSEIYHLSQMSAATFLFMSMVPMLFLSSSPYTVQSVEAFLDIKVKLLEFLQLLLDNVLFPQCCIQETLWSRHLLIALVNLCQIKPFTPSQLFVTLTLAGESLKILCFGTFLFCFVSFVCSWCLENVLLNIFT